MDREKVTASIRTAFAGVRLGDGVSLRQAQASDRRTRLTEAEWTALRLGEVTDDWSLVPEVELERDCIPFLDDQGLRYYLPAFMLWLFDHHDDGSMPVIGTLSAVAPDKDDRLRRYAGFDGWTPPQRTAMATYVEALPRLVELDHEDATRVERAIRDYWGRFLPEG